ncbi:MAG TPA: hypothetical protein VHO69_17215 [Phototrophicaceae bacterium]|nr:hypothetical protein [Phototrophicaceae bacterium]
MASECQELEKCAVFRHFRPYAQLAYMEMYCQGRYQHCQRYQLYQQNQPVPEDLLPHGGRLQDEVTLTSTR